MKYIFISHYLFYMLLESTFKSKGANPMTALQTMKKVLTQTQRAQNRCLTASGRVLSQHRYRYQILTEKAVTIRDGIKFLEDIYIKESVAYEN